MSRDIAIVCNESPIQDKFTDALKQHGYRIHRYSNRLQAHNSFKNGLPDLVLLDIKLGDDIEGGFKLCRELRAKSAHLLIIFFTDRKDQLDIVSGLRMGADDYLFNDISLPQFLARISAVFRRLEIMKSPEVSKEYLTCGELSLDGPRLKAYWKGEHIDLTLKEFHMIKALVKFPGHIQNKERLMRAANITVDDSTIRSHIKHIRRKFLSLDPAFNGIETVYGVGYRWIDEPTTQPSPFITKTNIPHHQMANGT